MPRQSPPPAPVPPAPPIAPAASAAPADRLLAREEMRRLVGGLNMATIYRMVATGAFPRPVKIGSRSFWRASEIEQWIAALPVGTMACRVPAEKRRLGGRRGGVAR